jgi:K+-sensing histidine kinase KdpD
MMPAYCNFRATTLTVARRTPSIWASNFDLQSNAANYADPRGHIWMTAKAESDDIILRVRGNGIGIGPELLLRAFDISWRASQTSVRSRGGLGFGLALVCHIVEMGGGMKFAGQSSTETTDKRGDSNAGQQENPGRS